MLWLTEQTVQYTARQKRVSDYYYDRMGFDVSFASSFVSSSTDCRVITVTGYTVYIMVWVMVV